MMDGNLSLPDFSKIEEDVLKYWKDIDAFQTSLKQSNNKQPYTFYDGPPFATGLPHYGHILAGTIKDVVTRYAHQNGFHVDRRFGWDCHGVPIEFLIDKEYNISGPDDVLRMGIDNYNEACRSKVSKYATEWEKTVIRVGRWIDFENDYKTMYPWYMESVWFVFKQIFNKGMVYRGVKVMPFSTGCATPLSNFEAKLNFKQVKDPAIVVSFPLLDQPEIEFLAWTTTPWTLPSNMALCVHPEMQYVKVFHEKTAKTFILLEALLKSVFKKDVVKILEKYSGKSLEGTKYKPLFDYFAQLRESQGAFRMLCDTYVTADSGTGIVHQSPYFGEDDYRICMSYGVITKTSKIVCPIDSTGKFTKEVPDFQGLYVKDADEKIVKHLKENGRLFSSSKEEHSYPFCYRSETPLLYRAVESWFIGVESIRDQLLKSNDATYWVPEFVKTNRFGNWLKGALDWVVSRNRYWGTPIPLWVSDDGEEVVCVGSREELAKLSGVEITDLHRHFIDNIVIPSQTGRGVLRRVPEVFDCWFESGSMPYASVNYPFKTKHSKFETIFPADFIAEGLDQTRGWFYTLTVIGTILFGKSPFKNLVVNGIILAEDGQKMSKSKGNFPDPVLVINKHGADALRMYLISSPVVRAQNLRFKESGVMDMKREVFGPWYNALKFLLNSAVAPLERKLNKLVCYKAGVVPDSNNILDKWIISETQSLIRFVREQMELYHLDTVIPRLLKFIDQLTNWYVKMNRRRLQGEEEAISSNQDWESAVHTLFYVSYEITLLMCPFVPFITEYFYGKLRNKLDFSEYSESFNGIGLDSESRPQSVHYLMMPLYNAQVIDPEIETIFRVLESVVDTTRKIRDREKLPLKWPLQEVVILSRDISAIKNSIHRVEQYITEAISVKKVVVSSDLQMYGVQLKAVLNHRELGVRLKKDYPKVLAESKKLTNEQLEQFQATGSIEILCHSLNKEDLEVVAANSDQQQQQLGDSDQPEYSVMVSEDDSGIIVALNTYRTQQLIDEGVAREIRSRIQRRRKELELVKEDPVLVYWWSECSEVCRVIDEYRSVIDIVVQEPLIRLESKMTSNLKGTCSLLGDHDGCQVEVRVGDNDELVWFWFCHDHSRLGPHNRTCSNVAAVDKTITSLPARQHVSVAPTPNCITFVLGDHVFRYEQPVSQDAAKFNWDHVKAMARYEFGWTKFPSDSFDLTDSKGQLIQFGGHTSLHEVLGKVYYL